MHILIIATCSGSKYTLNDCKMLESELAVSYLSIIISEHEMTC